MKSVLTIAWKDFKSSVTRPMFFLIAGLCSTLWSYLYLRGVREFAQQSLLMSAPQFGGGMQMNIHYTLFISHISYINIIFIFMIPALTMGLISEEKKMRTYDLLLTSPINATHIALGKFLAGFGTAMLLVLIGMLYPIGTALFADFQWAPLLSSFIGLTLMTAAYVAVGLFASSMTESVVLSVVMGVLFNLVLWFLSSGSGFSDNPVFTAIMEQVSIGQQLFSFLKGTFKVSAIVFFLSLAGLFVFLAQRVVESSRWR